MSSPIERSTHVRDDPPRQFTVRAAMIGVTVTSALFGCMALAGLKWEIVLVACWLAAAVAARSFLPFGFGSWMVNCMAVGIISYVVVVRVLIAVEMFYERQLTGEYYLQALPFAFIGGAVLGSIGWAAFEVAVLLINELDQKLPGGSRESIDVKHIIGQVSFRQVVIGVTLLAFLLGGIVAAGVPKGVVVVTAIVVVLFASLRLAPMPLLASIVAGVALFYMSGLTTHLEFVRADERGRARDARVAAYTIALGSMFGYACATLTVGAFSLIATLDKKLPQGKRASDAKPEARGHDAD